MIEMRWLEYVVVNDNIGTTQKKLQYRQQYNSTVYAGMPGQSFTNVASKITWSEWQDVPIEKA